MTWIPLTEQEPNPALEKALSQATGGDHKPPKDMRAFVNDRYQVVARTNEGGMTWLSIKTHDRATTIPWRHKQQIKNEICGPNREAVEIYPTEARLADSANEYHLWVFPEGIVLPFGFQEGLVSNDEQQRKFTEAPHLGRQEPWEEGLTTGRNADTRYMTPDEEVVMDRIMRQLPEDGDSEAVEADQRKRISDLF